MAEVTSIHAREKKKNSLYIIYRKSVVFIRVTILWAWTSQGIKEVKMEMKKKGYGDLVDKWEETLNKKNVKLCQNLDKNMSTFKITVHRLKVQARNNIFQVVWNVSADWSDVRSMYSCIKYKVDMNAKLTRTTKNNEKGRKKNRTNTKKREYAREYEIPLKMFYWYCWFVLLSK